MCNVITGILFIFIFAKSTECGDPLLETINLWCSNFSSLSVFAKWSSQHVDRGNVNPSKAVKILKSNDLSDLVFHGTLDDDGVPQGAGELLGEGEGEEFCFRGKCQNPVRYVLANFVKGEIDGAAKVVFQNGVKIFGQFEKSVLHGTAAHFDPKGRLKYVGEFRNGKRLGKQWYFDQQAMVAVHGELGEMEEFSGNDFWIFVQDGHEVTTTYRVTFKKGEITKGFEVNHVVSGVQNQILTVLDSEIVGEIPPFEAAPNLENFEQLIAAQATWLRLRKSFSKKSSIFKDSSVNLENLLNPTEPPRFLEEGNDHKCIKILTALALKPGSLHETALVSPLGGGSKWVGSLMEWATGIQGFIAAVSVLTPYYGEGAGLFTKTHHQVLQHTDERRRRQDLYWRMSHIEKFRGRGILLLRNPYDTFISHWTHRIAYNELENVKDIVSTMKTEQFQEFVRLEMKIWLDIVYDWISVSPDLLVLHYENFLLDPLPQLEKILDFLPFPLITDRLKCIQKNPSTKYKRKWRPKIPDSVFPDEIKYEIDFGIEKVQMMLMSKGFEPMPVRKYNFTNIVSVENSKKSYTS